MKFGYLTVVERAEDYVLPSGRKCVRWSCKCDCGNEVIVFANNLGKTTLSCGCFAKENMSKIKKKHNTYDLSGEYGIGYTSKGEEFWFDLEDYTKIKDYYWYKDQDGYFGAKIYNGKNQTRLSIHRLIMGFPNITDIDHINHNLFDNRKCNLREVTHSQNIMNSSKRSDNTSGFTGVSWSKSKDKWVAYIAMNGKQEYLGAFNKKEDAVKKRKEIEEKRFGEYSYENSINIERK